MKRKIKYLSLLMVCLVSYSVMAQKCPENLSITTSISSTSNEQKRAQHLIEANNEILDGHVEYIAGNQILLTSGFSVTGSATVSFNGRIENCDSAPKVDKTITLSPNPVKTNFNLTTQEDMMRWELSNQFGNLNLKGLSNEHSLKSATIDLTDYPTGIYFISITFKDGEIVTKTVIKE